MPQSSAVYLLVTRGAAIQAVDSQGYSVLHHAVQSGCLDVVQWLIENTEIDINIKDSQNQTPLSLCEAAINEFELMGDISVYFFEHGATSDSSLNCH